MIMKTKYARWAGLTGSVVQVNPVSLVRMLDFPAVRRLEDSLAILRPFGQTYPRDSGCRRSPVRWTAAPSSTVTSTPHIAGHMRQ